MLNKAVSILLAISLIAIGFLISANIKQRDRVGEVYLYNMESLLRTLSSIDKVLQDNNGLSEEQKSITYLANAVLVNQFPATLGISTYISDLQKELDDPGASVPGIREDIKVLYDAMHWLVYDACKEKPILVYKLLGETNPIVKEFNARLRR